MPLGSTPTCVSLKTTSGKASCAAQSVPVPVRDSHPSPIKTDIPVSCLLTEKSQAIHTSYVEVTDFRHRLQANLARIIDCQSVCFIPILDDMEELGKIFTKRTGSKKFNARLEYYSNELDFEENTRLMKVQRFHADNTFFRLFCTYIGNGIEFIENPHSEFTAEPANEQCLTFINQNLPAATLQQNEAIIFKGVFPVPFDPLFHRSPKAMGSDRRLSLVLDCPSKPDG